MWALTVEQLRRELKILERRSSYTSTSNIIRFVNGSSGIIHGTWDNPINGDIIIDDSCAINGSTAMVIWSGSSNPIITGGTLESMVGNITGAGTYSIYFHYVHGRYNVNIFNTEIATAGGVEGLIFTTNTGLTNTAGVLSGTASGPYGCFGVATKKLAAGNDGYIQWRYGAADGAHTFLAFNTSNTSEKWSDGGYEVAVFIYDGGAIMKIDGGGTALGGQLVTGTPISVGDYLRIERVGSNFYIKKSSDNVTYTTMYTFSYTSAADLFINANLDIDEVAGTKLYHPQGFNLSAI